MRPTARRLGLMLLALAGLGPLSGCFAASENPSYFPYIVPPFDFDHSHAKPPGPGYYANFDPHAVRLEVRPLNQTNPVRTQYVVVATVLDETGTPRRHRRVDWKLTGVGHILKVDEHGYWWHRGYQVDSNWAYSYTEDHEHRFTRGNANPNDDFMIRPGQTWCVISSPVEGDTHVTVCAPGIFNWDNQCVTVTCRWVDAAWQFPPPAVAQAGTEQVLTTRVFRHTDQQPLAGYRVRYRLLDGPAAQFLSADTNPAEAVARSDLGGNASVRLVQSRPQPGVNRIAVEVIRPPDPTAPSGSGIVLATGETTVEWVAPQVALTHSGPDAAAIGQDVAYVTTVANVGKLESRSMKVTSSIPEGMDYVRSSPPAVVLGGQLLWTLGRLAPGQPPHRVEAVFRAKRLGPVTSCAEVQTEEGLQDKKCVSTQITQAALKLVLSGPAVAVVGQKVSFQVGVANPGGAPARNVKVLARFDEGLEHASKRDSVEVSIAELRPGLQLSLNPLELVPRKTGRMAVRVEATADGGLSDHAEQVVEVQEAKLSVSLAGPKKGHVGLPAEWEIRVSNPGKTPVSGVTLRNVLPPEVAFQSSTEGGQPGPGEVVWDLGTLAPGAEKRVRVTATCQKATLAAVNRATATADSGLSAADQATLEIVGHPALKLEMKDEGDPVEVGKNVTYRVRVTNTGTLDATGVEVKVILPPELQPLAEGTGGPSPPLIVGRVVTFGKVEAVLPRVSLDYAVVARALKKGDVRVRVEVTSGALDKGPVWEEESTRIYEPPPAAEARTAPARAGVPVPMTPTEGVPTRMPVGPPPPPPAPPR
jgi:uncharacterized repeat protein (TIGR01451 family)